jgi:hypothetical protein
VSQSEGNSSPGQNESTADEAMSALTRLFSVPNLATKAYFRCGTNGPTDADMFFESMFDDLFGPDTDSDYKCWVRRLHELGLISTIPSEWQRQTIYKQLMLASSFR